MRALTALRRPRLVALVATAAILAALPLAPAHAAHADVMDSWTSKTIANLPTTHAAYVPSRNVLLVTVRSSHPSLGNELVEMNPNTGQILRHVNVGSQPVRIAVSDDGAFAYVALKGASAVSKVDLAAFTVAQTLQLPKLSQTVVAEDVAVAPGQPNLVAVSMTNITNSFPHHAGVVIFNNGVALPTIATNGHANRLTFLTPSTLLGFTFEVSPRVIDRYSVNGSGVTLPPSATEEGVAGKLAGGTLLAQQSGKLYDLSTKTVVRTFNDGGVVEPVVAEDRVAFFREAFGGGGTVQQFVLSTGAAAGEKFFPGLRYANEFVATGTGYAVAGSNELFLIGPDVDASAVTIPAAPASTLSPAMVEGTLPFVAKDVVWDDSRNVLYALTDASSPTNPGELVALDPNTRAVVRHIAVGSAPVAMDATDDLSALYIALDGATSITRVDLGSFTVSQSIPLANNGTPTVASDIDVLPGSTETFAVAMHAPLSVTDAVAVYDGATQRTTVPSGSHLATIVRFQNATSLYGGSPGTDGYNLTQFAVSAAGVTKIDVTPNWLVYAGDFAFDSAGTGWSNFGMGFEPSTPSVTTRFEGGGGFVIDEAKNRIYQAAGGAFFEYDKSAGRLVGQRQTTNSFSGQLVRFGSGFAAIDSTRFLTLLPQQCNGLNATIGGTSTTINGTSGNDVIVGTPGNDVINAGAGDDLICGGGGKDVIRNGDGNDHIIGSSSDEWIEGGAGNDTLEGNAGIDYLFGDAGDDTLQAGAGNDRLLGGAGADDIDGGAGTDVYSVGTDNAPHSITLDGVANDGLVGENDNVRVSVEIVTGSPGNDAMTAGDHYVWFIGVGGNDTLTGDAYADRLDGSAGDDTLDGKGGDDFIVGGDGSDTCIGGTGTNSLFTCES